MKQIVKKRSKMIKTRSCFLYIPNPKYNQNCHKTMSEVDPMKEDQLDSHKSLVVVLLLLLVAVVVLVVVDCSSCC